jgi:hypothetical protein
MSRMRGENCRPARLKIAYVASVCPAVSVACSAIGRSVGLPKIVEHGDGLAPGGWDDRGAVSRVLVGDVGVSGGSLVEEVARQRPGGEAVAALRESLRRGPRRRRMRVH